jgi:hypothetical protein
MVVRFAPGVTIIPDTGWYWGDEDSAVDPEGSLEGSLEFHDAQQDVPEEEENFGGSMGSGAGIAARALGGSGGGGGGMMDFNPNQSMAFNFGSFGSDGFDMGSDLGLTMNDDGVISDSVTGEYYFNSVSQVPAETYVWRCCAPSGFTFFSFLTEFFVFSSFIHSYSILCHLQ